jgi:hydrogenase nickel incorporation protein HypB
MMEIDLNKPILEANERLAAENRALLAANNVFMLDVMASPGAGKTSLIIKTIEAMGEGCRVAVIEGDVASDVDAQRIKQAAGVPAVQINTGGACHLEASMVAKALAVLPLGDLDLVIVENVGNLVCPTEFDLGASAQVVILSVPEGDDKPLKYPGIFAIADAVIVNKVDAMPLFDFDMDAFDAALRAINPQAPVFRLSARSGEGMGEWVDWLMAGV